MLLTKLQTMSQLFIQTLTYRINSFESQVLNDQSIKPQRHSFQPLHFAQLAQKTMSEDKKEIILSFYDQLRNSLFNFLSEAKSIFPKQFITKINSTLQPGSTQLQNHDLSTGSNLLQINELCLYHMAQIINDYSEKSINKSVISTVRDRQSHINLKDYQVLQEAVQKAQQQVRKHIGIEHQMKICLEQLEDEFDNLTQQNQDLKKQNIFLKKQLSLAKKKEIEVAKKLNQTEQKISFLEQKLLINKQNKKFKTEPQSIIPHESSKKSLKKSFESQKQKSVKKHVLNKTGVYSKLGSRKTSKLGLHQNQIDVNLHNFITINTHMKNQAPVVAKTEGKQVFWNKRLKKKDVYTVNQGYTDYTTIHNAPNRSLNISPRQLKKQNKEKQLQQVYASNSRELRRSYQPTTNQDTATKKKQKRDYSNADAYLIKRTNNITNKLGPDRSKSVVY